MRLLILICFLLFGNNSNAQSRNSIWCFGDSAGINFNNLQNPVPFNSVMRSRGSCASISDHNGNLLFYCGKVTDQTCTNGIIWNRNNLPMANGSDLNVDSWYHEFLIIPDPADTNLYFIFHEEISCSIGLYYSIVDMSADNGLGAVVQKNVFINCCIVDALAAVKHANGRDWWLITLKNNNGSPSNEFQLFLISVNGISSMITQNLGAMSVSTEGDITFSKDGSKMMVTSMPGLIEIFDFDRCTGIINNYKLIEPELHSTDYMTSNCISPNNRFAYVSSNWDTSYVIQYDLTANPINSSADTVGTFYWPLTTTGTLRLGPNNKIYLSNIAGNGIVYPYPYQDTMYSVYNMYLGVINNPDSGGLSCDFQPYSFFLGGKRTYYGLPNNPNYELGAVTGSICDSLIGISELGTGKSVLQVFPNPCVDWIEFTYPSEGKEFKIRNSLGEVILRGKTRIHNTINISELNSGLYFIEIEESTRAKVNKI
jgi:hypothetical protein